MRLRVIAAALLGGLAILSSTIAAPAKDVLKPRKIGVIVITLQSESLARWATHIQAAAAKLNWQVIVKDGDNNPAVVATALPELLNEGVDAVITMAVDAPLMAEGLAAAKAKNVPVIATAVDVNPAGKSTFTAVYATDSYGFGVALADYLVKKNPKAVAVGQTATIVYAADRLVVGAKDTLAKERRLDGGGGRRRRHQSREFLHPDRHRPRARAPEGDGPDQLLRLLSADRSAGAQGGQSPRHAADDAIRQREFAPGDPGGRPAGHCDQPYRRLQSRGA